MIQSYLSLEDLQMLIRYRYKQSEELFHVNDLLEYLKIFDKNLETAFYRGWSFFPQQVTYQKFEKKIYQRTNKTRLLLDLIFYQPHL